MILTACENLIVPSKPHPCTRPAGALICMDEGVMNCRRTILQSASKSL